MNELVNSIIENVGVNQEQAEGGLGALLNLAKEQMGATDFSKVNESIGGADMLIEKFSKLSSSGGDFGGLFSSATSALGIKADVSGIASVVASLSSLNLDLDTLKKFAPIISKYLENNGHGDIASKINQFI